MRLLLRPIMLGLFAVCCLPGCDEVTPEELAMLAARGYYSHLIAGEYEQFLEGYAQSDSLPGDYRQELTDGVKQFVAAQEKEHGGITSAEPTRAENDTTLRLMQVFMLLHYGDSTSEEIVVPMVQIDGTWKLR